ncbi:hypothetical protein BJX99DRAFT_265417 [Aspergillus californicus]
MGLYYDITAIELEEAAARLALFPGTNIRIPPSLLPPTRPPVPRPAYSIGDTARGIAWINGGYRFATGSVVEKLNIIRMVFVIPVPGMEPSFQPALLEGLRESVAQNDIAPNPPAGALSAGYWMPAGPDGVLLAGVGIVVRVNDMNVTFVDVPGQ